MTEETTIRPNTIRPGLLVSLKTTVSGNVTYDHEEIEATHRTDDGAERRQWQTARTVADPEEHARAIQTRSRCITVVRRLCAQSAFGMLCPEAKADELAAALAEARTIADTFNAGARLSRVSVYAIVGRVAQDDVEATRAINSEVRGLLADMEAGIKRLDVEGIRKAARDAKNLESMLSPEAAGKVQAAIEAARSVAKKIVAAGETAVGTVDQITLAKLAQARTAFLDIDEAGKVQTPQEESRALDLMPQAPDLFSAPTAPAAPAIELENRTTISVDIGTPENPYEIGQEI